MSEIQKKILQEAVQRMKDNNSSSKKFMENLSDESLCQTALYQNYWISTVASENLVDLLAVAFDLEIK